MRTALFLALFLALATAAGGPVRRLGRRQGQFWRRRVRRVGVVVIGTSGPEQQTRTGPDGRFAFDGAGRRPDAGRTCGRLCGVVAVGAGDAATSRSCSRWPRLFETVTVTPTRTRAAAGRRASQRRTSSRRKRSGSLRLSSPTTCCGWCRPSACSGGRSSLSSHPTAQGVSLRGIGPSGVSRTLVLVDGMPFNDPFGGWVYWTRVPMESVEPHRGDRRIELEPLRQLRAWAA